MTAVAPMPFLRRTPRLAGLAVLLLAISGPFPLVANDWAELRVAPDQMLGSLSCASGSCHGSGQPRTGLTTGKGQEYLHWLGGTVTSLNGQPHYDPRARVTSHDGDPHASAGQRLLEPRFQDVLRRASNLPGGDVDPRVATLCANCHDPLGQASAGSHDGLLGRGIGCESCHGAARDWVANHYQRGVSRSRLTELGMFDTNDVLTRARVCASCHVGSTENDVNHDLLAAGHPPLRFEMASYEALITRKHWNDAPRRLAEPDYEIQLWAAGRIASTDAVLALVESRALQAVAREESEAIANRKRAVWPEFSEYNCFTCHQSLRPTFAVKARRGFPWQTWNMALTPLAPPAEEALGQLRTAMELSLIANPPEIAELAAKARSRLHAADHAISAEMILTSLADEEAPLTWEFACQELAAIMALERGRGINEFRQRAHRVGVALRFSSSEVQRPAVFGKPGTGALPPPMSLLEVKEELGALRQLLATEGRGL